MDRGVDARSSGGGEASLRKALRAALASGIAVAALIIASPGPAWAIAIHHKPAHPKAAKKQTAPKVLEQPLIEVSIAKQQLTLYDKGQVIAHAPVSTGMAGHLTPTGIFSVLGKEVYHRSNIYSGAPMPFMQRITWSGIALHAGVLPGHPASHGCIRMPPAFAIKLFHMTKRGARVLVMHNEVPPQPFESPRLFTRPKPADEVSELGAPATAAVATVARAAATPTSNVMSNALGAPHAGATPGDVSWDGVKRAQPDHAKDAAPPSPKHAAAAAPIKSDAAPVTENAPGPPIEIEKTLAPLVAPPVPAPTASLQPYGPERPLRAGPITVFLSKKEGKLYVRKGFQPVFSAPISIVHPEEPLGTHLYTAVEQNPDGVSFRWVVVTLPNEHVAKKKIDVVRYVTLKGRRLRKVEKVDDPTPPSATAAEALDRIDIPQAVRGRIAALMSPGASLIISDKGLGDETGSETDFIVLTSK